MYVCVKRLCRDPPTKNVQFVIGFAYVNHYENEVNYTCSYRRFTQLLHGTIRIGLSVTFFKAIDDLLQ